MYEENSMLWDTRSSEYRNREKKQKIVQEFAVVFNCTPEEVQRKLHNLRNQIKISTYMYNISQSLLKN